MRISDLRVVVACAGSVLVTLGCIATGCSDESCIRFSDCATGYSCNDGHCVPAATTPTSGPDVDGATSTSTPTPTPTPTSTSTSTPDAHVNLDAHVEATSDALSDAIVTTDAGSDDAASDN